ncbi:MAG: alpha/beta fold hydrolase, partial [Trebonia sp.]
MIPFRKARLTPRLAACAAVLAILGAAGAVPAEASTGTPASTRTSASTGTPASAAPPDIVTAPTLVASTHAGAVGYREVGTGSPILLITGFGGSMDSWPPSFVDALAARHTVVVFD